MTMTNLSISTRLWLAIGAVSVAVAGLLGASGVHTLRLDRDAAEQQTRQDHVLALSLRWAGQTEVNVQRVIATVMSKDPAVGEHFKAEVKATTARINELQKELEGLADSAEEKAQLAQVAQARKAYIAAREVALERVASGDIDAARTQLQGAVLPAVKAYLDGQRAFVDLEGQRSVALRDGASAQRLASVLWTSSLALVVLLGLGVAGWSLIRSIVRPLREVVAVSRRIGEGDLTVAVDTSRGDEIGEMQRAMAAMRDSLRNVVQEVRQSTDSIQVASGEVAQGNLDLSQRTEETAGSLQETASSLEQINGTVSQTADASRQASDLAVQASDVARRGGSMVAEVVSTMTDISASSNKISDIIGVIDGIAFQTNILALNAAVEAARAGEQGRGFAVVASEVRSLAQRSAQAAREIKALIGASVERVGTGTHRVAEAGRTMDEIVASVQRVADIIAQISHATGEQSAGIGQVNGAVAQLDQMTQQNAALVEQSAAAAASLQQQAQRVTQAMSVFRLQPA